MKDLQNIETPVLWFDWDVAEQAEKILKMRAMPILVFNYFQPNGNRKKMDALLSKWKTQMYYFDPQFVSITANEVQSVYRTDCFDVVISEPDSGHNRKMPITTGQSKQPDRVSWLWKNSILLKDYDLTKRSCSSHKHVEFIKYVWN